MTFFNNIIHFCRAGHFNQAQMSELSFENENQPSSVSSCLTLNVSSILMSSLSSLINAIFITVLCGSGLFLQEFFCVWTLSV